MYKIKNFVIILLVLIVIIMSIVYMHRYNQFDAYVKKLAESPIIGDSAMEKIELTAMEAFSLAFEESNILTNEELLLIHLQSSDDTGEIQTINAGVDGKRSEWGFSIGTAKGNISIDGNIRNGKCNIVRVSKDDSNSLQKGRFRSSEINIDSPAAIKRTVNELKMKPGNPAIADDWLKGYHFTITGALTNPNSFETRLVLRVTGISPNSPNRNNDSLRMNVFFDGRTGEMVSASEQIGYDHDGHSIWHEIELD